MTEQQLLTPTQIVKSKRKTLSLVIKNNGDFIVRVPTRCKDEEIFKFINQKKDWIIKKRIENERTRIHPIEFKQFEVINILGMEYKFDFYNNDKVILKENIIYLPQENIENKFIQFLKRSLKKYINQRIEKLSDLYKLKFSSFGITSAKTCWGSCNNKNKINFSFRLIFCPVEVIDYVILHELCHTKIKNHSDKFWLLVKSFDIDYKQKEKWLKRNRSLMNII